MMEKSRFLFMLAMAPILAFMGCGDDDISSTTPPPPSTFFFRSIFVGMVLDRDGLGVADAQVVLQIRDNACRIAPGSRSLAVTTDDAGEFKAEWVTPGGEPGNCFSVSSTVEGVGTDSVLVFAWPPLEHRADSAGVFLQLR